MKNELVSWSEQLATGLPDVDREHRRLLGIINALGELHAKGATAPQLIAMLDELRDYTVSHFKTEASLMRAWPVNEANRAAHLKAHAGFVKRIEKAARLIGNAATMDVVDPLLAFLINWLVHHISSVDVRMVQEIAALREGSAVAAPAPAALANSLVDVVSELCDSIGARTFEIIELNHRLEAELKARQLAEAQVRELNHSLEQRVAHRTAQLMAANEDLAREMEERKKAQAVAVDYSEQLQEMTRRYVGAQEAERRRLARELHDRVSSSLSAVGLNLDVMANQLAPKDSAKVQARLADTMALIKETIAISRDISFDLHPALLDYSGVLPAINDYGRRYADRTGIRVDVSGSGEELRLSPEREIALYRIAQEALTNCVKHAGASRITVELSREDERILLTISDDGSGFDPDGLKHGAAARRPGLGLLSMRERAQAIGAGLKIESLPQQGTRIVVSLPGGPGPSADAPESAQRHKESAPGDAAAPIPPATMR